MNAATRITTLFGAALLAVVTTRLDAALATAEEEQSKVEDTTKAEEFVLKQFPVRRTQGMPPVAPISEKTVARTFPEYRFFIVGFRQWPVAQVAPEPLKTRNLFVVTKDGKVQHLTDRMGLEEFFRNGLGAVTDIPSARDSAEAWLRLTEEFTQDGFFKFAIPKESLITVRSKEGWSSSGKVVVTEGGKGEIRAALTFDEAGRVTKVAETNTVKPGVRPKCQATKLLDPDTIVRQMAEQDILVMGRAARQYLEEQRAKVRPELKQAIDRIWQRIVDEGW
jgi:hypothetical protein